MGVLEPAVSGEESIVLVGRLSIGRMSVCKKKARQIFFNRMLLNVLRHLEWLNLHDTLEPRLEEYRRLSIQNHCDIIQCDDGFAWVLEGISSDDIPLTALRPLGPLTSTQRK